MTASIRDWLALPPAPWAMARHPPHGTMRGRATNIDDAVRIVLTSPTGMQERIPVAILKTVQVLPGRRTRRLVGA